jgi:hypothetical protein
MEAQAPFPKVQIALLEAQVAAYSAQVPSTEAKAA